MAGTVTDRAIEWLLVAGAIVSALIAPFYVWWFKPQFTFPVSMLSCLILLRHHDNIQRLWRRQETKSGRNSKESAKRIPSDFWWIYMT